MPDLRKLSATSNLVRFPLKNATTGQGLTGLTKDSVGLIISTITDVEATATVYTQAAGNIETITTLGTFAAPTASKCRFKEVDATNHKGLYEFQFADARFAVSSAKRLVISITGPAALNLLDADYEIELISFDPFDSVRLGLTALPNAAAEAAGGLYTRGSGAGQINQANNGQIDTNVIRIAGTVQTARDIGASVLLSSGTGTGQLDFTAGVVKANAVQLLGTAWLTPATAGTPDVNAKLLGGTAQTGRDVGASVLLSAGTGTGQLDFTSGVVKSNLVQILATALTETAGQLAAGFKKLFNVTTPVFTLDSINQTGDSFARLGAPAAASIAADLAEIEVETDDIAAIKAKTDNLPASPAATGDAMGLTAGAVQAIWNALTSALTTVGSIGKRLVDNIDATISSRLATSGYTAPPSLDAIGDEVWDELVADHLGAGTTGASLNAAGSAGDPWATALPGAYGAGTAGKIVGDNVDAKISTRLPTSSYTAPDNADIVLIKAKTDNLPASPAAVGSAMTLTSGERDAIANAQLDLADGVQAAGGSAPAFTVRNALRQLLAMAAGFCSGMGTTTGTVKDPSNTKSRVVATVDADGNRTPTSWDNS